MLDQIRRQVHICPSIRPHSYRRREKNLGGVAKDKKTGTVEADVVPSGSPILLTLAELSLLSFWKSSGIMLNLI